MAQPPYPPSGPAPPYGPYGTPPPYPVPPPKKQDTIVLVILVLVIVAIALLALVVFAVLSFFTNFFPTAPRVVVAFSNPQIANGNASFAVDVATEHWSPPHYSVNLQLDATTGTVRPLNATSGGATPIVVGSITVRVVWTDLDGDGTVSRGDLFAVEGAGVPLPAGHSFVFYLLWSATDSVVGSQAWTI